MKPERLPDISVTDWMAVHVEQIGKRVGTYASRAGEVAVDSATIVLSAVMATDIIGKEIKEKVVPAIKHKAQSVRELGTLLFVACADDPVEPVDPVRKSKGY